MSTLADKFLKDFEISDHDRDEEFNECDDFKQDASEDAMETQLANAFKKRKNTALQEESEFEMLLKHSNIDEIVSVAKSEELRLYLADIENFLERERNKELSTKLVAIEEDPEYEVIVKGNEMVSRLISDIQLVHRYLRDIYTHRWPELEQLVPNALDYARCIKQIGNDLMLARAELTNILPSASIISLSVAATTTSGKPLTEEDLQRAFEAADLILSIDSTQRRIIQYIESRMKFFAPNLSVLVGSEIAAKLIGIAGGISALARMVSGSIQALGIAKKGSVNGMSTATTITHFGYLIEADLVKNSPPSIQSRVCRLLSGKTALVARVDSFRTSPNGEIGLKLREEIEHKIEKWQEPPPPKKEKALALPDMKPRSRRGGRRARKLKQNYAITELRKRANRLSFGKIQEDIGNEVGNDLGMLAQESGSGLIRVSANYDDKGFRVKSVKQSKKMPPTAQSADVVSGAPKTCGLATSIYANQPLGPSNALQLKIVNLKKQHEGYFSSIGGFTSVIKKS
ncbi:uncharacterized protein LOC126326225 [Schistocerca gregaria]|uniref:uncharacterized protein LOC126326225 n=1 Tax=Schistocerca gregaria TaxID=7010 RepID=UPI00211DD28E|nr:uncharacterized protein LOC126326225 [Schistocerca gregaria]